MLLENKTALGFARAGSRFLMTHFTVRQ